MDKIDHIVHPKYVELLRENPASRPGYVEVYARGRKFVGERRYPRGTNNVPEPGIEFTNADIISKFRENADGVIPGSNIDAIVEGVMALETLEDLRPIMLLTGTVPQRSLLAERQVERAV
jgi:hypothetical protein